jgi:histidinol phosphatase-like PHP family hydrolase
MSLICFLPELVDHWKCVVVRGSEIGSTADGTVDVRDGIAGAAHDMVVVVTHVGLVAGDRTETARSCASKSDAM